MRNEYRKINDDCYIIYLRTRKKDIIEAKIDGRGLDILKEYDVTWYPLWRKDTHSYSARATMYLGKVNGKYKYKCVYMHRLIMNAQSELFVDHKNHDTLDNRFENLIMNTVKGNSTNRLGANRNSKSGHRNVSWIQGIGKYVVQLQVDGKNTRFGEFEEHELEKAVQLAERMRNEIETYRENTHT